MLPRLGKCCHLGYVDYVWYVAIYPSGKLDSAPDNHDNDYNDNNDNNDDSNNDSNNANNNNSNNNNNTDSKHHITYQ